MKQAEKVAHAANILKKLKKLFPNARVFLHYKTDFELLVAVILSAQCTDDRVNAITPKLFKRYKNVKAFAEARVRDIESIIFSSGFYHAKAKHIIGAAKYILRMHEGVLPRTMEEMIRIPGVGRKTANVVLGTLFHVAEGIAVDTHVRRLSRVFGLSTTRNVVQIEKELMTLYPKKEWNMLTYYFIEYGRAYCPAKKHDHTTCPIPHIKK